MLLIVEATATPESTDRGWRQHVTRQPDASAHRDKRERKQQNNHCGQKSGAKELQVP